MFEGQSLAVSISRIRLYHVYMQIVKRNTTFTTGCLQVKSSWIFRENDDNFNLTFVWMNFHEFSKRNVSNDLPCVFILTDVVKITND